MTEESVRSRPRLLTSSVSHLLVWGREAHGTDDITELHPAAELHHGDIIVVVVGLEVGVEDDGLHRAVGGHMFVPSVMEAEEHLRHTDVSVATTPMMCNAEGDPGCCQVTPDTGPSFKSVDKSFTGKKPNLDVSRGHRDDAGVPPLGPKDVSGRQDPRGRQQGAGAKPPVLWDPRQVLHTQQNLPREQPRLGAPTPHDPLHLGRQGLRRAAAGWV